jgi:hypothetical protein
MFILSIFIILIIIAFIMYNNYLKTRKWTCKEGNCELIFGGKYDTKNDCELSCSNK